MRVPIQANAFIGRQTELAQVESLFARKERLITLTGPAGIGKTRLSCEYGARRQSANDGTVVCFADLSAARDLSGLCRAVGEALEGDVPGDAERALRDLAHVLSRREGHLVIVDNVEQVIEPAARALAFWIAQAPNVRWLVTGRERLRIASELVIELGPLAVTASPASQTPSDAAALLLDRAARTSAVEGRAGEVVALAEAIVSRLEGIPLAIELAAARLGVLEPAELLARLDRSLDVLNRASRGEPSRPGQTLRDTIAWSFRLLDPVEQRALAQCTAFPASFTLAAAETVLDLGPDAPPVLDVLHALRDKSLLRASTVRGERRLALYAAVREYAREQLDATGDGDALRARHARYYARLTARHAAESVGRDGIRARGRLAREIDNVLAVLTWAAGSAGEPGALDFALRTAASFETVLYLVGCLDTFTARLGEVLDLAEARDVPASVRGAAIAARGVARTIQCQIDASERDLERARALARDAGDRGLEARVLCRIAEHRARFVHTEAGLPLLHEALAIQRALGDERVVALTLLRLGCHLVEAGRSAEALDVLAQALESSERSRNAWATARTLFYQAMALLEHGRALDAEAALSRAEALHAAADEPVFHAELLHGLVEHVSERWDAACGEYSRGVAVARAQGNRYMEGVLLGYLGAVLAVLDRPDEALARCAEGVAVLREIDERRYAAHARAWMGALEARSGRIEQAAASFAAAETALDARDPLQPTFAVLRVSLDLARARVANDPAQARAHLASARARSLARATADDSARPRALPTEVRIAMGAAAHWLAQDAKAEPATAVREAAMVVHRRGHWFRLPSGRRVDCRQRQAIRRLLVCLAESRCNAPGRAVAVDALVAAGWPESRVRSDIARRRLLVSLARLRAIGLREVLTGDDDGYWLDPRVPVEIVED